MTGILGHSLTRHGASESTGTRLTASAKLSFETIPGTARDLLRLVQQ